jgi:hypothetical protein
LEGFERRDPRIGAWSFLQAAAETQTTIEAFFQSRRIRVGIIKFHKRAQSGDDPEIQSSSPGINVIVPTEAGSEARSSNVPTRMIKARIG